MMFDFEELVRFLIMVILFLAALLALSLSALMNLLFQSFS